MPLQSEKLIRVDHKLSQSFLATFAAVLWLIGLIHGVESIPQEFVSVCHPFLGLREC